MFESLGIDRYGLRVFNAKEATIVIYGLKDMGIEIIGVDAFRITPNTTQPIMEHDLDLSFQRGNSWEIAHEYVASKENLGLYFEFVLAD
ncbi:hypothetical protein [Deinococcus humi]|uniref:Uncharacterized protein n=1 Tax=Deinococcus humi TaxID=662880 RepID=A0A7W8NHX7_9DEIO|nr:hypothetical protein [Deinococcus humi]MBB5366360.1 hypothetical protein [Deinococcus humi]